MKTGNFQNLTKRIWLRKMKTGNTKNQGFAKKSLDFWRQKNPKNNKDFLGLDAPRMINSCGFLTHVPRGTLGK